MKAASFYHKDTGILSDYKITASDPATVELNTPKDHIALDGHHDHLSKRVDIETGEVIDYQPPAPSDNHDWNVQTRRWQLNAAAAAKIARSNAARARIAALEAAQHRHVREICLGRHGAVEALQAIDDEIFSLRSQI